MGTFFSVLFFVTLLVSFLPYLRNIGFRRVFEYTSIWLILFILIGVAYTLKSDLYGIGEKFIGELKPGYISRENEYLVISRASDGHYYVDVKFNNIRHKALVDTGASVVMVPYDFATEAGMVISGQISMFKTANGLSKAARSNADLQIGDITFKNFPVYVQAAEPNMFLIGMSFLENFAEFKFENDKLYLKQ